MYTDIQVYTSNIISTLSRQVTSQFIERPKFFPVLIIIHIIIVRSRCCSVTTEQHRITSLPYVPQRVSSTLSWSPLPRPSSYSKRLSVPRKSVVDNSIGGDYENHGNIVEEPWCRCPLIRSRPLQAQRQSITICVDGVCQQFAPRSVRRSPNPFTSFRSFSGQQTRRQRAEKLSNISGKHWKDSKYPHKKKSRKI